MFLNRMEIKKEGSAILFPKPGYIVLRGEPYILYTLLRFSECNITSNTQQAASGAWELCGSSEWQ